MDPLEIALERLRERFPGKSSSWLRRALLRVGRVRELPGGHYEVEGMPGLGDRRPLYHVWLSRGRWLCTCYLSPYGWRRSRDICTHVAAVMLYRQYRRELERLGRRRVYVASAEVECPGRLEASGELHAAPAVPEGEIAGGAVRLTYFARPRYRVLVISSTRRIVIKCAGHAVMELEGEE
ncbi:MAG: hypothetical protein LM577_08605, partial [Thermoproteaceae archaeon]|nr:hypothetical protein [Thermoproteaceae archaeon]